MLAIAALSLALSVFIINVQADYDPNNLPAKSDPGHNQFGYNDCVKRYGSYSKDSLCQNIYLNNVQDFCLYAPAKTATIGDTEAEVISYCVRKGHGTRLMPKGTLKGAHFLKTPSYVQVTGTGDLTKINIQQGDEGGELDPHGATGAGNPVGGLVFTNAFGGQYQQIHEWQNFMAYNEYCFRGCIGPNAAQWCPHIYDLMGCYWNEPANYDPGVFEECYGTEGEWPGVYHGSTWYQGQNPTPAAQTAGKSSDCKTYNTVQDTKYITQHMQTHRPQATPLLAELLGGST